MKWVRRYSELSIAAVATAVLSFCMADGAIGLAGLSVLVLVGAFVMRKRDPLPSLPKVVVNVLVLAAIINAGLRGLSAQPGSAVISHLGEFLVFVQLIKLFDRRTHRDETQLLTLSVFISIAAILTSNSFVVGVLLLIYSPLIIACSMLVQIRQGSDRAGSESSVGLSSAKLHARGGRDPMGRRGDRQFAALTAVCTVAITLMAIVVFVLTPRGIGNGGLGNWGQIRQATIGFTDTVKLGQSGLLNESSTPVLDLLVTDAQGRNLGQPGKMFYLRGAVQSTYNARGRVWQADEGGSDPIALSDPNTSHSLSDAVRSPSLLYQKITVRNLNRAGGHLFAVWRPVDIVLESGPTVVQRTGTQVLRYRDAGQPRFSYQVVSDESHRNLTDDPPADMSWNVPEEVASVAISVLGARGAAVEENEDPGDRARLLAAVFRDYLRNEFEYTTDLPAPPPRTDPIAWFLTESKRGHCEYFASALATMLQSMNVPARLVTGYVAGEFNELTGEYIVRESNAHAWVEVYLGDGRWARYDATPVGVVERLHQPTWSLSSQIRQWYDLLEFNWSTSVVGFDRLKQEGLLGKYFNTSEFTANALAWLNRSGERLASMLRLDRPGLSIPPIVLSISSIVLISALASFLLWSIFRRNHMKGRNRRATQPAELRFLAQAEHLLSRAGVVRPAHRSPLEHARVIAAVDSRASTEFGDLAKLFYKAKFGKSPISPEERRWTETTLARLREYARQVRRR